MIKKYDVNGVPHLSLHLANVSHSRDLGMSRILPRIGKPVGPGGKCRIFFPTDITSFQSVNNSSTGTRVPEMPIEASIDVIEDAHVLCSSSSGGWLFDSGWRLSVLNHGENRATYRVRGKTVALQLDAMSLRP